jgi:hypothetical protein
MQFSFWVCLKPQNGVDKLVDTEGVKQNKHICFIHKNKGKTI